MSNELIPIRDIIKVSSISRSTAVAGAIAGIIREDGRATMQAVGASAVNQATKAIAIARGYLERDGLDIYAIISFTEIQIEGDDKTAIRFEIEVRK